MSNIQSNEQRLNWLSQIEEPTSCFEELSDFEASKVNGGRAEFSQTRLAYYYMIPKATDKAIVSSLPKQ